MEAIAPFFNGDTSSAFLYIALIYDWSNKYGYITYKKDKAVFDSGLRNGVDRVFALFLRNPQPYQPWILDGFVNKDIMTDLDSLPTFVLSDAVISKQDEDKNSRIVSSEMTLFRVPRQEMAVNC